MRILIIGPGALGAAQAVALREQGHAVFLAGLEGHPGIIPAVEDNGGCIKHVGGKQHEVLTGSVKDGLDFAEVVMVAVPASAHDEVLKELAVHQVVSNKTVIALPGGAFAARAREIISDPKCFPKAIVESTTSPFACRRGNGAEIKILGMKANIQVASWPAPTDEFKASIDRLFSPKLIWYPDLASIFITCTNATVHTAAVVENFARAEKEGHPDEAFYREWVPKAMKRILAMDAERLQGATKLGLTTVPQLDLANQWYGTNAVDYNEFVLNYVGYGKIKAPDSNSHRYFTEDLKHLLMMMRDLINSACVDTPVMDDTLAKGSVLMDENVFFTGSTRKNLGLSGATSQELIARLNGEATN